MSDEIDKLIEDAVEGKIEVQFARVDGEPVMFYPDVKKACRAVAKAARRELALEALTKYGLIRVNIEKDIWDRVLFDWLREIAEEEA